MYIRKKRDDDTGALVLVSRDRHGKQTEYLSHPGSNPKTSLTVKRDKSKTETKGNVSRDESFIKVPTIYEMFHKFSDRKPSFVSAAARARAVQRINTAVNYFRKSWTK